MGGARGNCRSDRERELLRTSLCGPAEARKAQPLLPGIGKTTVCYQPKGVVG